MLVLIHCRMVVSLRTLNNGNHNIMNDFLIKKTG